MAIENPAINSREQVAEADADTLTTSLTAKGVIHNLEAQQRGAGAATEAIFRRNIAVATALDPLPEVTLGNVLVGISRQLSRMDERGLGQVARTSRGVLTRMNPAMPLSAPSTELLRGLERRAEQRLAGRR